MICIDTMVLIWGVQGVAKPQQSRMVDLTRRFLDSLGKHDTVMVPAVVLAEYLSGFENERDRLAQYDKIGASFFVPAFDAPSASLAAEIARSVTAQGVAADWDRRLVKADIQIIATAVVHNASVIVTHNVEEFQALAGGRIRVEDIPVIEVQENIFRDEED